MKAALAAELRPRLWGYASLALLGAAAVFLAAVFADGRALLRRHVAREAAELSWMVFLKSQADRDFLEESIRAFPGIESIRFISRDEAVENVRQDAVLSQTLALAGRNPLPDSFDVRWKPFFLRADYLVRTTEKVSAMDGVDHVAYDPARVDRLGLLQGVLYGLDLGLLGAGWTVAVLLLALFGRLLFFPRGPFPGAALSAGFAAAVIGGLAGLAAARPFVQSSSWRVIGAAAVVGLVAGALRHAFREA